MNVVDGSCFLQIDRHDSFSFFFVGFCWKESFLSQFFSADLTPASGRATEIEGSLGVCEEVVDIIDLQKFIRGSGPIALLLGLAIVDILN